MTVDQPREEREPVEAQILEQSAIGIAATSAGIPVYWSGHAITPETLKLIQHLIDSMGVRSVLELGSGISTLLGVASDTGRLPKEGVAVVDNWLREFYQRA